MLSTLRAKWNAIPGRLILAGSLSLVILAPCLLFLSPAVVPPTSTTRSVYSIFLVMQLVAFLGCVFLPDRLLQRPTMRYSFSIVGSLLFSAGILGISLTENRFGLCAAVLVGGGYAVLVRVCQSNLARLDYTHTAMVAFAAFFLAFLEYFVVTFAQRPFGCIAAAIAYPACFTFLGFRLQSISLPFSEYRASTVSRVDALVLQKRRSFYLCIFLSGLAVGYCVCFLFDDGLLFEVTLGVFLLLSTVVLVSVLVLVAVLVGKSASLLLTMFCATFLLMAGGLIVLPYENLRMVGILLILLGYFYGFLLMFVYQSAVGKTKGYTESQCFRVAKMLYMMLPLSLMLGAVLHCAFVYLLAPHDHLIPIVIAMSLTVAVTSMLYSEIVRTRHELIEKTETTVSMEAIRDFALRTSNDYGLTERECEIIRLVMSGRTVRACGQELFLSENTVKSHIRSIYKKLGVHDRQDMISLIGKQIRW